MPTIFIDNQPYEVPEGQNLLNACLGLGFNLPYFCWHPALGSVGACRQCAVKRFRDEKDQKGELIMACMTPAAQGTRISINDPEAVQFRASVIEWLMINHPHDCPVCDEGGECHLQDMTVMSGHNYRKYRFSKRTHRNQDLGPFIHHEMNRCIQCYRCVRYYHDYAGGSDLNVFACHDRIYFGRFEDGPLESEFSGNLVEICPTGVFTDKTLHAHYTRKWDLQTAPSVCVHCGLGCNTIPGERYGKLRRIRNRYHPQVNGYFLCDRGRYGYEFINSDKRLRSITIKKSGDGVASQVTEHDTLARAAGYLSDPGRVIGIGSPRATLEANFALRTLVGADHFFAGLSEDEYRCLNTACAVLREGSVPAVTLQGAGMADAVLVLGEDITQTAPLLALNLHRLRFRKGALAASGFQLPEWNDAAVREFAQLQKAALYIAAPQATRLAGEALRSIHGTPEELARFGYALSHLIDPQAPAVSDLRDDLQRLAEELAPVLLAAQRPLIVSGTGCGTPALIQAAANIAWSLQRRDRKAGLTFCVPECNSMGLTLMQGRGLTDAFKMVAQGAIDTVIILENDLYRRAEKAKVDAMLQKARHVVVIDQIATATSAAAQLVLPSATFAEAAGTLVNNEGRAQRSYAVMPAEGMVRAAWRWLRELDRAAGRQTMQAWETELAVAEALMAALPVFQAVGELSQTAARAAGARIPRQTHRYSGRTAMRANIDVHEPKPPVDEDAPLAFSMEGYDGPPPPELLSHVWAPGWNSVQALNKFQMEVGGDLRGGDPGRRLIEPQGAAAGDYFDPKAAVAPLAVEEYRLIPLHHIFGSEELSLLSPPVAGLAPRPYVALAPAEGREEGRRVRITIGDEVLELPLKLRPEMPAGVAGLPVGLPGMPRIAWPAVGRLSILPLAEKEV